MTINIEYIVLDDVKTQYGFTDTQDDATLTGITSSANDEVNKRIAGVVDGDTLDTEFTSRGKDAALVFAESEIRRQINQLFDDAKKTMEKFNSMMASLLGDLRSIAPKRSSLEVVTRDVPFEDDYFAERHLP